MIFVTLGTTEFPFVRMDKIVDWLGSKFNGEELVYQNLATRLKSNNKIEIVDEFPFIDFIKCIKRARVVITHGGPATIFQVLNYSKSIPLVIPRKKKYGEHVDDHQIYFVNFLSRKNLISCLNTNGNIERLKQEVLVYCQNPPENIYRHNVRALVEMIENLERYVSHSF